MVLQPPIDHAAEASPQIMSHLPGSELPHDPLFSETSSPKR